MGNLLSEWNAKNFDAAVHGHTFLLLTPFSFVKLVKENDW